MKVLTNGVYVKEFGYKWLCDKFTFVDSQNKLYRLYGVTDDGWLWFPYDAKNYIAVEDRTVAPIMLDDVSCNITLREDQEKLVNSVLTNPQGVIYSPPGSGKTVVGCFLINEFKLRTLVLVPTLYLLNQWKERVETFLGYTPGIIGDGIFELKDITIAVFNSAFRNIDKLEKEFGLVIVDEAHRIAAETYQEVVGKLWAKYKIGMTGTLERKDGKEFIVTAYLGNVIHENTHISTMKPVIVISLIDLKIPKLNYTEALTWLAANEKFNERIIYNINKNYKDRLQLALTFRKAHLNYLIPFLPDTTKVITGDSTTEDRETLAKKIYDYRVILATTVLDEGADITPLDMLHLCSPFNNIPKLEQRIARVIRNHENKRQPIIFDYWVKGGGDKWSPISQQNMRLEYYRKMGYKILKQT